MLYSTSSQTSRKSQLDFGVWVPEFIAQSREAADAHPLLLSAQARSRAYQSMFRVSQITTASTANSPPVPSSNA